MARTTIIGQSQQGRAPRAIMVAFEKLERVADAAQSLAWAVNAVKIAEEAGNRIRNRLVFSTLGTGAGAGPGHPPTPVTIVDFCSAPRQGSIDAKVDCGTRDYSRVTPVDDGNHTGGGSARAGVPGLLTAQVDQAKDSRHIDSNRGASTMHPRAWFGLAVRVIGMWMMVQSVPAFVYAFNLFKGLDGGRMLSPMGMFNQLVVGMLLVKLAPSLAMWAYPQRPRSDAQAAALAKEPD